MVDIYQAYKILNKSLLKVANDMVTLEQFEFEDKPTQVRLEELPFSIAERRERLNSGTVVAHDLQQYVNKFYSIKLESDNVVWLDYLININPDEIDLTEFGEIL